MTQSKAGFRITTWPETPLPHPPLLTWRYQLEHDALVPVEHRDGKADALGEIYLRLRAIDLEDADAIVAFATAFGVLGARADEFAGVKGIPGSRLRRRRAEAEASLEDARAVVVVPGVEGDAWALDAPPLVETLSEFRLGADYLADLTDLWRYASGASLGEDVALRVLDNSALHGKQVGAARNLEEGLAAALRPFHPRVTVSGGLSKRRAIETSWVRAPLFSVCALELFNHIAEDATYRQCANASCGRLFVRHEGRARDGQYRRTGVRYCSTRCLRVAKQRDYRERNRRNANDRKDD